MNSQFTKCSKNCIECSKHLQVGRLKGKAWVLRTISQIYSDKIVADAADEREQGTRAPLCEYIFEWHLHRYGLRNLAEVNLLDLLTSMRVHAKQSPKISVLSSFCGLMDAGSVPTDPNAFEFYLACLQAIAHPSAIGVLIPDDEDGRSSIRYSNVRL